ncbi:unnamed protein product [Rhizoctonia solani]|uniref:AMP-dependent synthetase/ligase domain-containing protein n=1 Tax=Rhizoctonia solani TaxID=456999 RepID=A0A8H3HJP6_9AGAM|nr:unnamed protein product [Rhizoctonia solani]
MSYDGIASLPKPYPGPRENDPLTEDELKLLLAVPRAAESNPYARLFRLPLGPDPSMGWIDVTCAEVRSIVARLADVWKSKLSNLLDEGGRPVLNVPVGPGTTICIAVRPDFHGIFHLLAFWALGCTVQFVSMADPTGAVDQLNESGCQVMLCSGYSDEWVKTQQKRFNGTIVQLLKEEHADELAKSEKQGQADTVPWPTPQRPTPMLILQSSGTTGRPKLLRTSLYYLTIRVKQVSRWVVRSGESIKTPHSHPCLVLLPCFWMSLSYSLLHHLVAARHMAFAYVLDIYQFPPNQLIDWAIALDAGAIMASTGLARLIPKATYEAHAEFFRSLYSFSLGGSTMSSQLSAVFEELQIPAENTLGLSEIGFILYTSEAPYTHLRPYSGAPHPLVRPITEYNPDGSRHVELWITPAMSPSLAHNLTYGNVPIKLQPFPGDGPHKGELAFNLEDIFQEIKISDQTGSTKTAYVHAGRHTDEVRLGQGGFGSVDGALYEGTITADINTRISRLGACPWRLDGVQLFGNNMACTALVIQLRPDESLVGTDLREAAPIQELRDSVERTNDSLGLTGCKRVHAGKRTLIISADGMVLYGPGGERLSESCPSLSLTHKRTPKRWENVCRFKSWLDGLDFNED